MKQVLAVIFRNLKSDFKDPNSIFGSLLFLISSLFVCYISINRIASIPTWVALFWIIVIFASFNAVAKSFVQETRDKMIYIYSLMSPAQFIIGKMLYNGLLLILMSLIAILIYSGLFEMAIGNLPMLLIGILLGSACIGMILSLLSSIASKASGNLTLMAILGLPIMLPLILTATKFTKNAVDGLDWSIQYKYLIVLIGLNIVCGALSVVLFPYLWRE